MTEMLWFLQASPDYLRRHEMDHALEADRQVAHRHRRADGERGEEPAGQLHGC
jgi:hypothetical protein